MAKVYVFLADGFEDVEALIPIDVLRRGGQEVVTVSVMGDSQVVESAHGVQIVADALFDDVDLSDAKVLLLPGGMPGASNLYDHEDLKEALISHSAQGGLTAAICAAPGVVLGQLGLLRGKRATCYPGFEKLLGGEYTGELCTVDGNFVTAEGPAAAFPFAYKLLEILAGEDVSRQIATGMRYAHLMNW